MTEALRFNGFNELNYNEMCEVNGGDGGLGAAIAILAVCAAIGRLMYEVAKEAAYQKTINDYLNSAKPNMA